MGRETSFNTRVFLLIFTLVLIINVWLFWPMFHSVAFAAILAGIFYPLFLKISKKINHRKDWASLLTCLVILHLIVLPLIYIIIQLSKESVGLYSQAKLVLDKGEVRNFFFGDGPVARLVQKGIEIFDLNLTKQDVYLMVLNKTQNYSGLLFDTVNGWVGDMLSFLFQFFVMMIIIYGFFIEGEELKEWSFKLSPLPDDEDQIIFDKFKEMNFVTLVCNGIGGLIQGLLAGLGFWLAGIDAIFLWSTVMTILAFIPLVGISFVFIPTCLYLYLSGQVATAIILFIYCFFVSLIVENVFKPRFIGTRVKVSGILLLLYIIAGMSVFGMAGIFYGPLLCVIFLTMVELFREKYLPKLQSQEDSP